MTQTMFITGANRGLGLALAARCLDNGHNVIALNYTRTSRVGAIIAARVD